MRQRIHFSLAFAAVVTLGSVGGCGTSGGAGSARQAASQTPVPSGASSAQKAAALVATLGDEDLVGQVLMPYAYGSAASGISAASQTANRKYAGVATPEEMVKKYRLGGLILVGWSADDPTASTNQTTNLDSPPQIRALTDGLQSAAKSLKASVPMLIGTDQEYGTVTRVREGVVQLPSALALGAGHDPAVTERAWKAAGADLAALGINVDFAPDADVLGSRPGGVIGSRSFGSDSAAVADQVAAAVRGLRGAGVAATLKHFPGHGNTTTDSHTDLPLLGQSRNDLNTVDFPPFSAGMQAGAELIMSGHLNARAIDQGVPATFSSKVLIDTLRGQLHFNGVVVSDSLNMAPAKQWPPAEAAVRALIAGNDLLLMPPNLESVQQGLLSALRSGQLPRTRLVEAATRVLTLRYRIAGTPQPAMSGVNSEAGRAAAAAASAAAVTVLRGACRGPLMSGPVRVTSSSNQVTRRDWLKEALRTKGFTVVESGGTRVHLVGYGDTASALAGDASVTVALDTPYVLSSATSQTRIATYSTTRSAIDALAAVLSGGAGAPGRSPVGVDGLPRSACTA